MPRKKRKIKEELEYLEAKAAALEHDLAIAQATRDMLVRAGTVRLFDLPVTDDRFQHLHIVSGDRLVMRTVNAPRPGTLVLVEYLRTTWLGLYQPLSDGQLRLGHASAASGDVVCTPEEVKFIGEAVSLVRDTNFGPTLRPRPAVT